MHTIENSPLFNMRTEYSANPLSERTLGEDPIATLRRWTAKAIEENCPEPNAAILGTISANRQPNTRTILIKAIQHDTLLFFTNYESQKAQDITHNPNVSLLFLWLPLARQVRIRGVARKVSIQQSKKYFATRPRSSQIAAWVSKQSQPCNVENLHASYQSFDKRFSNQPVPCPVNWGGYCIVPSHLEFWQGQSSRLHHRILYTRVGNSWITQWIAP